MLQKPGSHRDGILPALSLSVLHDGTSRPLARTLLGLLLVAGVCGGLAHGARCKRQ